MRLQVPVFWTLLEELPSGLYLDHGACARSVSEGCEASVFHFSWAENRLINVLNMLENAFLYSCKVTHLQNSLMCTRNQRLYQRAWCSQSMEHVSDSVQYFRNVMTGCFWCKCVELSRLWFKTDSIFHSSSIWDSNQPTGCDTKTFNRKTTTVNVLKHQSERVKQRGGWELMWSRQNGSWFLQHDLNY